MFDIFIKNPFLEVLLGELSTNSKMYELEAASVSILPLHVLINTKYCFFINLRKILPLLIPLIHLLLKLPLAHEQLLYTLCHGPLGIPPGYASFHIPQMDASRYSISISTVALQVHTMGADRIVWMCPADE